MTNIDKTSVNESNRINRLRNPMYAAMVSDTTVCDSERMWNELDTTVATYTE